MANAFTVLLGLAGTVSENGQKDKKILEVTSETSEVFTVRRLRSVVTARCGQCQRTARFMTPEAAANEAGISARSLYRLIEANQVHFTETDGGQLLLCLDSLSQKVALKQ
ncbi:MAG: hypothetical protein ACT4OT_06375 [Acidobacteriota bacterium]